MFSFAKFVMWNDLDARADELLGSPVVAHLAAGTGVAFAQPSGAAAAAVTQPPSAATAAADLVRPLDADASQLAAIAAAGAGASFVLQGAAGHRQVADDREPDRALREPRQDACCS